MWLKAFRVMKKRGKVKRRVVNKTEEREISHIKSRMGQMMVIHARLRAKLNTSVESASFERMSALSRRNPGKKKRMGKRSPASMRGSRLRIIKTFAHW